MALRLSVVVPMFNEQAVLPAFFRALRPVLDGLPLDYEVVCVDDGSRDATAAIVQAATFDWPELRLVRLLRNSGHQAALAAGYERSLGDLVITMDADLQDPPEVVAEMVDLALCEPVDVVYGVRADRSTDSLLKRSSARLYYRLMRRLAGEQVPADAGDFRLVTRRVIAAMQGVPEHSRVYRLIIPWFGYPSAEVRYRRGSRAAGATKYPLSKMLLLAVDSLTTFSAAPLRLATWAGALGVLFCVGALSWSLFGWVTDRTVPGWTSIVATVGLVGAVQLICVGLLGEYVSRLFIGSLGRPSYVVGFDSHAESAAARPSDPLVAIDSEMRSSVFPRKPNGG